MDDVFADERWTRYGLFREAARAVEAVLAAEVGPASDGRLDDDVASVLLQLARSPDERLRMTDLARSMALHPSSTTRLVDRCEADGLVERVRCEADRRVWWAALTAEGREAIAAAAPALLDALDRAYFDHLSDREAATVERAARRLRDAAQQLACVEADGSESAHG